MEKKIRKKSESQLRKDTENALLQRALGFEQEEIYLEDIIDKKSGEQLDIAKRKIVKKIVPPDVRALLFWLKNRYPDSWKERVQEVDNMDDIIISEDDNIL